MSSVFRARQKLGGLAIHGGIRLLERLGRLHPNARPNKHGVTIEKNLRYLDDGDPRHALDIYRPAGSRLPVILYFHGGAFSILSKDTHWVMGLAFARQGYLTLLAGYRLAPKHPYPAAIEDACAAWLWTLRNVERLGGDPSRIAVAGESAGANLALTLTLATCFRRPEPAARAAFDAGVVPRCALPACGIFQVSQPERYLCKVPDWHYRQIHAVGHHYLRGHVDPTACALADPLCILESDARPSRPIPPILAPVGDRDPLLHDTLRLESALRRRGVTVRAPVFRGEGHAFHALVFRANARACWQTTYGFLREHLA